MCNYLSHSEQLSSVEYIVAMCRVRFSYPLCLRIHLIVHFRAALRSIDLFGKVFMPFSMVLILMVRQLCVLYRQLLNFMFIFCFVWQTCTVIK